MKKQLLLLVSFCVMALPSSAAMNLYQASNGDLVLEATDCQNAQRLANLVGLPMMTTRRKVVAKKGDQLTKKPLFKRVHKLF